jgi:predicted 2-oxoglutarate/Fe(II)-dependent dioxygenase YbiX
MIYSIPEHSVVLLEELIVNLKKNRVDLPPSQDLISMKQDTISPNTEHEYYDITNEDTNKKLASILGIENATPITIHIFTYHVGAEMVEHYDTNSYDTFVIILEDKFEGGVFYLNGKHTEFKKRGDVARYNGSASPHEVTPITNGTRKVLVVWYPKKEKLM